ncbi:LPS export ABC transporter permease LptG [Permianibacter sp. IMCC34836]|uniref:LPS export ABC transporter permease LptG n=1 Tax=Permianibacter fluminis TaxID=2738515 RepID=UPI001552BB0A|nr:LPS export ABC transporter permease LptG [Permianibacter fluminis]NQD38229.1 LPS export ABC transporter permease LptG [Permianibacter fluminis]
MRILNRYIVRSVLQPTAMVLFLLVALRFLFSFLDELGDVGTAEYTAIKALAYTLLSVPMWLGELLPMATLIGTVMGLGVLSSSSELTAMRAAAVSPTQVGMATIRAAVFLILGGALLSEVIVPHTSSMAQDLRLNAIAPNEAFRASGAGVWLRSTHDYVFFRHVLVDQTADEVQIFSFSAPQQLSETYFAERAQYQGDGKWRLLRGIHTRFDGEQVNTEPFDEVFWQSELAPEHLQVLQARPAELSGAGLWSYSQYLVSNGLDASQYDLEFWRKVFQPLNLFAMMLAGIASVFGPLRSVTVSARVLAGVAVGLSFHYLGQIFGPVSLVYQLPPVLGALLPPAVFLTGALWLLRRAR